MPCFEIRKAIVVGATSGIGRELARCLWDDGATLGIAGRRTALLEEFAAERGERVAWQKIDVMSPDAGERLLDLIAKLDGVDAIVFCSGIGSQNPLLSADIELRTTETNVVGFTRVVGEAYRYFRRHGGGHIAVVSSIAGTKGLGIAASYSATKRYQNIYVQCLAQLSATERAGVTFTDIRPGFVDTDLLKSGHYPMLMRPEFVAQKIARALRKKRRVVTIDWRYRLLVAGWRLIPHWLWERLTIVKTKNQDLK